MQKNVKMLQCPACGQYTLHPQRKALGFHASCRLRLQAAGQIKAKVDGKDQVIGIKTKAKIDGFRKGNVPSDVLEQRYGQSIHADVVNELIQESYPKAITENKVRPASSPRALDSSMLIPSAAARSMSI